MKTSPTIVAFVVLLIIPSVRSAEPEGNWNHDVIRLFSLEQRDEALQKLLKEGRYPENPAYTEDDAGRIKEVVVCPQRVGGPLVTVFAASEFDPDNVSPRSGHFIVVRNDGVILPFYRGANSLDGYFSDLNGDGVMDFLDSWSFHYDEGLLTGLHLVPIVEGFKPALVVHWREGAFEWRLHQPDLARIPTIQIGTKKKGTFEPIAEYRWSKPEKRWLGPTGSLELKFLRVDGEPGPAAKKLLKTEAEQSDAHGTPMGSGFQLEKQLTPPGGP